MPHPTWTGLRPGKRIGGNVWVHRDALEDNGHPMYEKARLALESHCRQGFAFDVVKFSASGISFIHAPGFYTQDEPEVLAWAKVSSDGIRMGKPTPDSTQIYHHKWMFTTPETTRLDWWGARRRSLLWAPHVAKGQTSRIGRKRWWDEFVVPRIKCVPVHDPLLWRRDGDQVYRSEATSVNGARLPALWTALLDEGLRSARVLDLGGGKFPEAKARTLAAAGILRLSWDPWRMNNTELAGCASGIFDGGRGVELVVCSNVLNVIRERHIRLRLLARARGALVHDGRLEVMIHEAGADRHAPGFSPDGIAPNGAGTLPGAWQNKIGTQHYMEEIARIFPNVRRRGRRITAWG